MKSKLKIVLQKMFNMGIETVEYQEKPLQGGTLGDVRLVTGTAVLPGGVMRPFAVVWKRQTKWERFGDPNSWRREHDLYQSRLGDIFTNALRWPVCYHTQINKKQDEVEIWMEYSEGVSGSALTMEILEKAAWELGRLQGRCGQGVQAFEAISCLGDTGFLEREFSQWHTQTFSYDFLVSRGCRIPEFLKEKLVDGDIRLVEGKSFEYSVLRSKCCEIPEHLRQMLMQIDRESRTLFQEVYRLPVVLCHKDFWIENIIDTEAGIRLIDWDTSGWGYLGEDIASLLVDDTDPQMLVEYYEKLVPAYLAGVSECLTVPQGMDAVILNMCLLKFGYRMAQEYIFSREKDCQGLQTLQKLYELRQRLGNHIFPE